jgi:hypothetical protein
MASNALDRGPLVARIKTLINTQLKAVLKRDGLPVSGAKAALQDRLITRTCSAWKVSWGKLRLTQAPVFPHLAYAPIGAHAPPFSV